MNAEPEPQDVEEAWRRGAAGGVFATWFTDDPSWPYQVAYRVPVGVEQAIRADERKRWAEREQQLVEALRRDHIGRDGLQIHRECSACDLLMNQERPA